MVYDMSALARGRILGIIIVTASAACSVYFVQLSLKKHAEFQSWIVARPMQLTMDLSKPGELTVPLHQTCTVSHGEDVFLIPPAEFNADTVVEDALASLTGSVSITNADGVEIARSDIDGGSAMTWGVGGDIRLGGMYPFPKGEYNALIQIETGVPELTGTEHTLYAAYNLCGLELLPARFSAFVAFGFGITALVAAVCVVPGLIRHGLRLGPLDEAAE
jgi:hypothetical protein